MPAPDFALRDQDGRLVRLSARRGKLTIVTFLYTRCPDVCPVIADQLNEALRSLNAVGDDIGVLAVSVDPAGDTQTAVRRFVTVHRLTPRFRYLRGSAAELKRVWRAYHVAADPTGTAVAHSALSLLLDPTGVERLLYTTRVSAADVVHDVNLLVNA